MSVSWKAVRRNLTRGMENLGWMARFFADRVRKETVLAQAAYAVRRLEEEIEEAYLHAGQRLYAVRHKERPASDPELVELLGEIERLSAELDDHAERVHGMEGSFPEEPGEKASEQDSA